MSAIFASAEDVESAFYEAITHGNLEALMSVWADDEEIICIHPTGQRLRGAAAIRESWRTIFASNPQITVLISHSVRWSGMLLCIHNVVETLYVGNEPTPHGPMLATNVFQRGANGWHLLEHHSSPAAETDHDTLSGEQHDGRSHTLH